ncbi:hypothetical protein NHX12_030457, partial [Muraenolepis orangiensis]
MFPNKFDVNNYANIKSFAQSMLDTALLMANATQLKSVLEQGPEFTYYFPVIALLIVSLSLQFIVGIVLVFIVTSDLNDEDKQNKVKRREIQATGL